MWPLGFRRIAKVRGSAYEQRHRNAKITTTVSGPPNLARSSGLLVEKAKERRLNKTRTVRGRPDIIPGVTRDHLRYLEWLYSGMESCGREISSLNGSQIRRLRVLLQIRSRLDLNYNLGFSCRMYVE